MSKSLKNQSRDWKTGYVKVTLERWAVHPTYVFRRHIRADKIFIKDVPDVDEAKQFAKELRLCGIEVRDTFI